MESRLHFKLHYSKYVMRYQSILKDNKDYGEGNRVVLNTVGCYKDMLPRPKDEIIEEGDGLLFGDSALIEIYSQLDDENINGISIAGGEPLHHYNRNFIYDLIENIKSSYANKTIWLYTGYTWNTIKAIVPDEILSMINVIIAGPYKEDLKVEKDEYGRVSSNPEYIEPKNMK